VADSGTPWTDQPCLDEAARQFQTDSESEGEERDDTKTPVQGEGRNELAERRPETKGVVEGVLLIGEERAREREWREGVEGGEAASESRRPSEEWPNAGVVVQCTSSQDAAKESRQCLGSISLTNH